MVLQPLRRLPVAPGSPPLRTPGVPPLARLLLDRGVVASGDLVRALELAGRNLERLPDILLAHRMVSETDLAESVALAEGAEFVDPLSAAPDARLLDAAGVAECLRSGVLPWRHAGAATVVLAARRDRFEAARPWLEARLGPLRLAIATEASQREALLRLRRGVLGTKAEALTPAQFSCRGRLARRLAAVMVGLVLVALPAALLAPRTSFALLAGWAILTMLAVTGLRTAAAVAAIRERRGRRAGAEIVPIDGLPIISLLVPLYREKEIAAKLVRRLARLDYPRELLDICLVVEEHDTITQGAVAATRLPAWMRQVVVPRGTVQTKPRALNYALDFCRGAIIGVYDAEDAPAPDQLRTVASRFAGAAPDVACLQGVLDFYNPRQNWLARCFTIEYATWFRLVLPGLARLGMPVPLGGTTLFFRREPLESLGGWDAHNVTEDADLGMRLARAGWRTELIESVTEEEAACHPVRWVRQRSRWLKGYAMTWAVHMRRPLRLWRELGTRQFLGFQLLFLGTLSQFVLAPVLWSFWLLLLGLPHPLAGLAPPWVYGLLTGAFLLSEAATLAVGMIAVAPPSHRWLLPWVPTLHFYFPLGSLAVYKGLWEMVARPFYWDKTPHGHSTAATRWGLAERAAEARQAA